MKLRRTKDDLLSILVFLNGAMFLLSGHHTAAAIMWVAALLVLRGKV